MEAKLKICGMREAANIASVAELQPDYMGFIFYPQSPRCISEVSAELIKYVPPSIKTTGVFVNEELEKVIAYVIKYNLKAVQLHGQEDVAYCAALAETGAEVIKAFGIGEDFDFEQLKAYEPVVDYFLFDTQTPVHGGSGKVFDWTLLAKYTLDKRYFLSGGIGLEQVETLKQLNDPRLYAIDVNSKFEVAPGLKDVTQLKEFITLMNN
ncbi:phosphoribosylanthranilate isomerase [Pedobacter sp. KR3-3]|uniref:N-(5'-phosphoribosyl)anthranilate isomerase n=1 Tax=Pedobacter albus TaxID=3113905 RepID=A0ABU7I2W9_9SPHI|nr:phosphoribosylanthranilate isomerase [Pedobacter sp. KR3-3]MEE1943817.1 phosphoribosylanthranilate isomerase [Pedobacter sp. KR3-3]